MDDSNRDHQDNERYALKAIYGDQLTIIQNSSSTSWTPLECVLKLGPQGIIGQQLRTPNVTLHVICSDEYPSVSPLIKLDNYKGITNIFATTLHAELENIAKQRQGEVIIFDLAQHIEKFLSECYEPQHEPQCESFYDEMIERNKFIEEKERQEKQADEEKKKIERKMEIYEKQQAVKKALRKRRNSSKSIEEDGDNKSLPDKAALELKDNNISLMDHDIKLQHSDYTPWSFTAKGHSRFENEFEHLNQLGSGAYGDVIKVRNKLDDGLYAIKRIELNPSEKNLNKKITREVKLLSRLNHENVVRYYNSWIESVDIKTYSSEVNQKAPCEKQINDEALKMLPINETSVEWNVDVESASSDESSSDWILFGSNSHDNLNQDYGSDSDSDKSSGRSTIKNPLLYLYIQMELCNKSTLRCAIDKDLHTDLSRVWRLFKEIVEGLCHIHQQGIIHRDLKPVNIFIGNDDHVKIGDFGLATTILLQKQSNSKETTMTIDSGYKLDPALHESSISGQIGTALYVAPELNNFKSYNQKVDIYSLGIIFYEMCHPPMKTSMERIQILLDLRQPEPVFSDNFPYDEKSPQRILLRCMLQHDIDKRPTSQELLQSPHIPVQKLEDNEIDDMIQRTLANPHTRTYKYLIKSCFNQSVEPTLDATYNILSWRSAGFTSALEVVTKRMRTIFQNHGASCYLPPLLTPAAQVLENGVSLLTRLGSIVHATYDLQMPFARYLAHGPNNSQFKRYAIDKVYRERPAGVHPKEYYECSFDIVTPTTGELLPEYEMFCVLWEILREFSSILSKNCTIYLNHSLLVSVMMKQAGIDGEKYKTQRINIFTWKSMHSNKCDFEMFLKSIGLSERSCVTLCQWIEIEGPLNKISSEIFSLVKDKAEINMCQNGLEQIKRAMQFCELIGISCPVSINLGNIWNGHYYSGLMVQVQVSSQKQNSKQSEQTTLVHGGRYDNLVQQLKESLSRDDGKTNHYVAGFTMSIDKFLTSIENSEKSNTIDVLVCAMGQLHFSQDKLLLLRDIWKSGVKMSFINTTEPLEELQTRCKAAGIPIIVLLKETEGGYLRIRTLTKDRYIEKKVPFTDLLEYLQNKISMPCEAGPSKPEIKIQEGPAITFISLDKFNHSVKRRYESQILNNLSGVLQKISKQAKVDIIASNVEGELLKAVSCHMESTKNRANASSLIKKYPRHKKIILKIIDHLEEAKHLTPFSVFIIYCLLDNSFKVLL